MGTTRSLTISRGLNVSQIILLALSKSLFAVYRLRGINSLLTRTLLHPMYGNSRQSWILEGFQELVFEFFARWLWFWTPIVSGIPESLEVGPHTRAILLQTAFHYYNGRVTTSWENRSIYSHYYYCSYHCKQPTFSYGDVVHHWSSPLQWAIWVTKPIYILTFSYRPKSSSIMYCKAIYPSGLWLLTNDDCCAKNKVVSRVLAPARSW